MTHTPEAVITLHGSDTPKKSQRAARPLRRFRVVKYAFVVLAAVLGTSLFAGTAGASTAGQVTYLRGTITSVVSIQGYYCDINYQMPSSVIHYAGTTELFQYDELDVLINGVYYQSGTYLATATSFFGNGNQLQGIYWGNYVPGTGFSFTTNGSSSQYRLIAITGWYYGNAWHRTGIQVLGYPAC